MPVQGTDLGEALAVSLDAFDEQERQHRVLIVITDGEDHEGEIDKAVARAAEAGVKIYTVGVGSPEGVPIPNFAVPTPALSEVSSLATEQSSDNRSRRGTLRHPLRSMCRTYCHAVGVGRPSRRSLHSR